MKSFLHIWYLIYGFTMPVLPFEDHALRKFKTGLSSTRLFLCGRAEVCEALLQFCNTKLSFPTCIPCSDYHDDCFTQNQQYNCTQFCLDQHRQTVLSREEAKNCTTDTPNSNETLYLVLFLIVLAIALLLAAVLLWMYCKMYRDTQPTAAEVPLLNVPTTDTGNPVRADTHQSLHGQPSSSTQAEPPCSSVNGQPSSSTQAEPPGSSVNGTTTNTSANSTASVTRVDITLENGPDLHVSSILSAPASQ